MKKSGILKYINNNPKKFWLIIVLLLLLFSLGIQTIVYHYTKFEKVITIREKYTRYRKGSNYNIVDTEGNIYQVDNLWFKLDYNRANDYAKIEEGKTYKVKGYGYRAGFIDAYKKIYDLKQV
jgi:hypothetical protein